MRMPFHRVNYEEYGWNENNDIQQHDMILMSSNRISIFFFYVCMFSHGLLATAILHPERQEKKTYTNTFGYSKLTAAVAAAAAVIKPFYDVFNLYQHKHTHT